MNDAIPQTPEQVLELVEWYRKKDPSLPDPDIFVSYLISECGANPLGLRLLLWKVWQEAAEKVEVSAADVHRHITGIWAAQGFDRRQFLYFLERAAKADEIHPTAVDMLLEEFDALKTPQQVPEVRRAIALERNRKGLAVFPNAKLPAAPDAGGAA
jgi:hypothetical protein